MQISQIQYNKAGIMPYANQLKIQDKAGVLIKNLSRYLRQVPQDEDLFFKKGELVYIPDLHGDFVHMILTLHRHNLLDNDLNLRKDYKYVFLGDFYNRGEDSDAIDHWVNKQIQNGIELFRLGGNHEVFFVARDKEGNPQPLRKPKEGLEIPSNDVIADINNNFQITEDILRAIKDGSLLASFISFNEAQEMPEHYSHSFVINDDFKILGVDCSDLVTFSSTVNKKFRELGQDAYTRFIDGKNRGRYDWEEIKEPFYKISTAYKNLGFTSFLMRITGVKEVNGRRKIKASLEDYEIPHGVYQIVGHTVIPHFDLSEGHQTDRPFVLQSTTGTGKVQFSDVGIGFHYNKDSFERPDVIINKRLALNL